jgi:hypothetical protein
MITEEEIMSSEVRALSWKQPYAYLMLHGKVETRAWPTKYRGLVLICSSKKMYTQDEVYDLSKIIQLNRIVEKVMYEDLPLGCAFAIARLVDCRPMTAADEDLTYVKYREPWTVTRKGKYGQLRIFQCRLWCHIYEDVTPIRPFTYRGAQGWRTIKGDWLKSFIEPLQLA